MASGLNAVYRAQRAAAKRLEVVLDEWEPPPPPPPAPGASARQARAARERHEERAREQANVRLERATCDARRLRNARDAFEVQAQACQPPSL